MNAGSLSTEKESFIDGSGESFDRKVTGFKTPERLRQKANAERQPRRGFAGFIHELRRRRVCRAVTTYCVAFWLVCQVVEILSPELGLPDWTLRFVIIQGIIGFPIALVVSWLFEVTPNGLLLDRRESDQPAGIAETVPRGRLDKAIDCGLLAVALVIGLQMAVTATGGDRQPVPSPAQRIAVMPFPVSAAIEPDGLSAALLIALQHELANQASITVLAPGDPSRARDGSSLTGAVMVGDGQVRVTTIMIDNQSGEVTWSELFQMPYSDAATMPAAIARRVVEALGIRAVSSFPSTPAPIRGGGVDQSPSESNMVTTS